MPMGVALRSGHPKFHEKGQFGDSLAPGYLSGIDIEEAFTNDFLLG